MEACQNLFFLTSLSLLHSFIGLLILILPLDYPFPDQPFRHQLNYLTSTTSYISCPFEQLFESTLVVSDLDDGSSKLTRSYVPNLTSVVSDVNSPYKPGFMTMVKSFLNFCSSSDSSFESHNLLSIRPIFSFLDSYSKIFK